jgi:hypothetical protein
MDCDIQNCSLLTSLPKLSSKVQLTRDYAQYADANDGPLIPGQIGEVIALGSDFLKRFIKKNCPREECFSSFAAAMMTGSMAVRPMVAFATLEKNERLMMLRALQTGAKEPSKIPFPAPTSARCSHSRVPKS